MPASTPQAKFSSGTQAEKLDPGATAEQKLLGLAWGGCSSDTHLEAAASWSDCRT